MSKPATTTTATAATAFDASSDAPVDAPSAATPGSAPAGPSGATTTTSPDGLSDQRSTPLVRFTRRRGVTVSVRAAATRLWIIYRLTERAAGRIYIGITQRELAARLSAHLSRRRDRGIRPDGLMAALQAMEARGATFATTLDVEIVGRAVDAAEAAEQERAWIAMLDCRVPNGLNGMPGGGVGGPASSQELAVEVSPQLWINFPSIFEAIGHRNRELWHARQPLLDPRTVYARLATGWSPEEGLGYAEHVDGRGRRAAFLVGGHAFDTLRQASRVTGLSVDALRARHHRQLRHLKSNGPVDIGADRRSRNGGIDRELLAILWPETGERLTSDAFSRRTGVPAATVRHRWHRARAAEADQVARGGPPLSASDMADRLRAVTDRRKQLTLVLPDGRRWTGGEREVIRRLFADMPLEASRSERLSESAIRRRVRLLSDADRRGPDRVREAFGFSRGAEHGGDAEPDGPPDEGRGATATNPGGVL